MKQQTHYTGIAFILNAKENTKPILPIEDCDTLPMGGAEPGCDMGVAIPIGGGGPGAGGGATEGATIWP